MTEYYDYESEVHGPKDFKVKWPQDPRNQDTNSVSDDIRNRILQNNGRFFANDNISEYIEEGELELLVDELEDKFKAALNTMVIDLAKDPNSADTPRRLAKMYIHELFEGRYQPKPRVASFPNDNTDGRAAYKGMLVIRAELKSICSHHHQTVSGIAFIGIIPSTKVIGLSKYVRLAQHCARRGTLQEELCSDIAQTIIAATESENVGVHLQADHGCCTNRGVMAKSAMTQTTVLNGMFYINSVKDEFYNNIKMQHVG
jgi:GTP cyclohydrolase I